MKLIINQREAKLLHTLLIHELKTTPYYFEEYKNLITKLDLKLVKYWYKKPLK